MRKAQYIVLFKNFNQKMFENWISFNQQQIFIYFFICFRFIPTINDKLAGSSDVLMRWVEKDRREKYPK